MVGMFGRDADFWLSATGSLVRSLEVVAGGVGSLGAGGLESLVSSDKG